MSYEYYMFFLIGGIMTFVGMMVGNRLKSKFQRYSSIPLSSGLSGKQVAEAMLRHFNVYGVQIVQGQGFLSDHYNPATKTVSLSPEVYQGRSIAAAAVAAHEVGHAVQHDQAYSMLQFRSAIVPVVSFAAQYQQWAILAAFMVSASSPASSWILLAAIGLFMITTLFAFVTLPVEFDASNRALVWLERTGIAQGKEYEGARDALKWAAMTYVVAALSSLVSLIYLILRYMSRRN